MQAKAPIPSAARRRSFPRASRARSASGPRSPRKPVCKRRADATSNAKLLRKVLQTRRRVVDRDFRGRLALSRPMLVRPRNMRGAQSTGRRMLEIVAVGRNHHAFAWSEIERRARGEIDARLGLVVAGNLGAENRIPVNAVAAREVDHQR